MIFIFLNFLLLLNCEKCLLKNTKTESKYWVLQCLNLGCDLNLLFFNLLVAFGADGINVIIWKSNFKIEQRYEHVTVTLLRIRK
jgi:hypothetical protein